MIAVAETKIYRTFYERGLRIIFGILTEYLDAIKSEIRYFNCIKIYTYDCKSNHCGVAVNKSIKR